MDETRTFDGIFYDLGGTLRLTRPDAEITRNAGIRIAELCGEPGDPEEFLELLNYRYLGYRKWAFDKKKETREADFWIKWLTPEYDHELLRKNAAELTIEWRRRDGYRYVAEGGARSIKDLHDNGYKLGIISNLQSEQEIPRWLEADGLAQYFEPGGVLLSSVEEIRKPDPEIYFRACERTGLAPERCVYIGDNLKRDVEGTRLAGFGMFVLITTPEKFAKEEITDENRPDAIIYSFDELKEMFPGAPNVNWDKVRRCDR